MLRRRAARQGSTGARGTRRTAIRTFRRLGLPVREVRKAKTAVVLGRSTATGHAGVDNPLFYKENARMPFGDARDTIDGVLRRL